MMKTYQVILVVSVQFLSLSSQATTDELIVDLATTPQTNVYIKEQAPKGGKLKLINTIPNLNYSYIEKLSRPEIEGLTKASGILLPGEIQVNKEISDADVSTEAEAITQENIDSLSATETFFAFNKGNSLKKIPKYDTDEIKAISVEFEDILTTECAGITNASQKILESISEASVSAAVKNTNNEIGKYVGKVEGTNLNDKIVNYYLIGKSGASTADKKSAQEKIRNDLTAFNWVSVSKSCRNIISKARDNISLTEHEVSVNLADGFTTTLTIERTHDDDNKAWNYTWLEESKTIWLYNLSYVYIDDFGADNFFVESITDDNTQFVVREYSNSTANYIPAAMYTYVFNVEEFRATGNSLGASFGISMDPDKPGVLGGLSYVLGRNITLTGGIGFTKQNELRGRYTAYGINDDIGDTPITLDEQLDDSQLLESGFGLSYFFALGFTFE